MDQIDGMALVERETGTVTAYLGTTEGMALRLQDMKQQMALLQQFVADVMVRGSDYGVIPGTDKPTLLKPGAEKLCEFYGFAIRLPRIDEERDRETGYYHVRVTVALERRTDGVIVAEGVGEASTHEGRNRWRWTPDFRLPPGFNTSGLRVEERRKRGGGTFRMVRLENDDPWSLHNTVLKMAKKRALVDAVLSATRSSALFTQDMEDLREHDDAGHEDGTAAWAAALPASEGYAPPEDGGPRVSGDPITRFYGRAKTLGFAGRDAQTFAAANGVAEMSRATEEQLAAVIEAMESLRRKEKVQEMPA